MEYELNRYYPLTNISQEARVTMTGLLGSYPLTQACLEILGEQLFEKITFGFFSQGQVIIQQGDSGQEMYLLCEGVLDVVVKNQTIMAMEAPALLGDKAIVHPNAKRAASLVVSAEQTALLLQIPVGAFIHDFEEELPDSVFRQETEIFASAFQVIQQRLFDYVYLQKNLWDEVSATLKRVNIQFMVKNLDQQQETQWDTTTWGLVMVFLGDRHNFTWNFEKALTVANLRQELLKFLELQFPRQKFSGSNTEYAQKRQQLWKAWLLDLGEAIINALPQEKRPFQLQELELFNPSNYHMRLVTGLRQIEPHFSLQSSQNKPPSHNFFFGKGEHTHEFDLKSYLISFAEHFHLQQPQRTQARVAQKLALIAANCENQFNASVAKMREFLEKTKDKNSTTERTAQTPEEIDKKIQKHISTLYKALSLYRQVSKQSFVQQKGKIQFKAGVCPNINELLKYCGSESNRKIIQHAFEQIIHLLHIGGEPLPEKFVRDHFYLCEAVYQGDEVWSGDLASHYWLPLQRTLLVTDKEKLGVIPPGALIGGEQWAALEEDHKEHLNTFLLRHQMPQPSLMLVLPQKSIPWLNHKHQSLQQLPAEYLPLMQWLLNKYLAHLNAWVHRRDLLRQKIQELTQVIRLEEKTKILENSHIHLPHHAYTQVCYLLKNRFAIVIDPERQVFVDQLARKIYNHLITQMNREHPEWPIETRGNHAYTKWRFVLSEIIHLLERLEGKLLEEHHERVAVFETVMEDFRRLDAEWLKKIDYPYEELLGDPPVFHLNVVISQVKTLAPERLIQWFQGHLRLLAQHLREVAKEAQQAQIEWHKLSQKRPEYKAKEAQLEFIRTHVKRLREQLEPIS